MKLINLILPLCVIAASGSNRPVVASNEIFPAEYGIDLKLKSLKLPSFPNTLLEEGYQEGHLKFVVDIDYAGELRDWIVLESTHPKFTEALERVIETWRFSAPYIEGQNRSVAAELTIDFRSNGNVISFSNGAAANNILINSITGFRTKDQQVANIKDLDTTPYPIQQTKPIVSKDLVEQHKGTRAIFTFYVDESGHVRIPVLSQTDGDIDDAMVLAAQDAISQWRFEPPTRKTRPVKIRLSQAFVFVN